MASKAEITLFEKPCWREIGSWAVETPQCDRLRQVQHCRNCDVFSDAANALMDKASGDGRTQEQNQGDSSILLFRVGAEWVGVAPQAVLSLAERPVVHTIPRRSNNVLRGLVAVQGEVMICLCLPSLLGLSSRVSSADSEAKGVFSRLLILKLKTLKFAFLADEVRGICRFDFHDVRSTKDYQGLVVSDFVQGVLDINTDNKVAAVLLNTDALTQEVEKILV